MAAVLPALGFQLIVTEPKSIFGALLAIGRHLASDEPVLVCGEFFDVSPTNSNSRRVHCFVVAELSARTGLLVHDTGTAGTEWWSLNTFRVKFTGDIAVVRKNTGPAPDVE